MQNFSVPRQTSIGLSQYPSWQTGFDWGPDPCSHVHVPRGEAPGPSVVLIDLKSWLAMSLRGAHDLILAIET